MSSSPQRSATNPHNLMQHAYIDILCRRPRRYTELSLQWLDSQECPLLRMLYCQDFYMIFLNQVGIRLSCYFYNGRGGLFGTTFLCWVITAVPHPKWAGKSVIYSVFIHIPNQGYKKYQEVFNIISLPYYMILQKSTWKSVWTEDSKFQLLCAYHTQVCKLLLDASSCKTLWQYHQYGGNQLFFYCSPGIWCMISMCLLHKHWNT